MRKVLRIKRTDIRKTKYFIYLAFLCASMFVMTACSSEHIYLNDAYDLYKSGNYKEAETAFLRAVRNGEKSVTVFSGYAFNQLKLGDTDGAKALFELMINQKRHQIAVHVHTENLGNGISPGG